MPPSRLYKRHRQTRRILSLARNTEWFIECQKYLGATSIRNPEARAHLVGDFIDRPKLGLGAPRERGHLQRLLRPEQDAGELAAQLAAQFGLDGATDHGALLFGAAQRRLNVAHHAFHAANGKVNEYRHCPAEMLDQHVD